jgi:YidC/Oxa1 family membrane protein insertase
MEKRALLAFVISLLILIAWSLWFTPPSAPPPPKEDAPLVEKDGKKEGESVGVPLGQIPLQTYPEVPAEASAPPVTVETPLYAAKISPNGGMLHEWKLKHYRESLAEDSPLVNLVSVPEEGLRPLQLRLDDKVDSFVNTAPYQFDKDTVQLHDGEAQTSVRASLNLPGGLTVTKQFTFHADSYLVDLEVGVCDSAGRPIKGEMGLIWPQPSTDSSASSSSYSGPIALSGNSLEEVSDIKAFNSKDLDVQWAGFALRYFVSTIVPLNDGKKTAQFRKTNGSTIMTITQGVRDPTDCRSLYKLYLGPKTMEDLKRAEFGLDKALNYGFFDIIARPLLVFMKAIDGYTHNYGIAIIILTILIKLLFWPLTHKSYVSMKEMQRIQPRIKQIRERFKNDKEQLNREMMLVYRTHKVNPLGGCLPMVLQIPVFFALYKALMDSIELRHAPFVFWVKDLAAPDYLLQFPSGVNIFGIEGIGPLPLLMGLSMVIQQKMTPTMGDPMQAKVMMFMPIFFTFLFISFPSGLVLYWLTNNVLSIVQQIYINARVE